MMRTVFQEWRRECEAVQREMDRLITAGRPQSAGERQVRALQFTAECAGPVLLRRHEVCVALLLASRAPGILRRPRRRR